MIYKCKMCGGSLEIKDNETIAVCEYCGTKQTLPKLDSERKSSLLDRADHFRRNNEYDKAMSIYEQILADEKTDSEVYWLIVLCRYGIEYVEDPSTHKRIPTVNRVQYNSILNDEDYLKALELADSYQKDIYIEEANKINGIQKGILEISNKEEPFDIFICYKETDDNSRRTEDSVIAQDIYKELTSEGYKVFFSRITLEDKIGTAYEPYIFAALNSAKVMLVIGTKIEYFNAVWVKNEWSRYLSLINKGDKKILVPCYKNMDPYDLPEEFAYLQAQDLNKLGFMQDLTRGIEKIVPLSVFANRNSESSINNNKMIINPLIERMFSFIDEKNWEKAEEYSEKILDIDPNNGYAYLGKLLNEYKIVSFHDAIKNNNAYEYSINYKKMMKYADDELRSKINKAISVEKNRVIEEEYLYAYKLYLNTKSIEELNKAIDIFKSNLEYKDSEILFNKCNLKLQKLKNDELEKKYNDAKSLFNTNPRKSIQLFSEISEYSDSEEYIKKLNNIILELDNIENLKKKKTKRSIILTIIIVVILASFVLVYKYLFVPYNQHRKAIGLISQEKYDEAYEILIGLGLDEEIFADKYNRANVLYNNADYASAYNLFTEIDYKDSHELADNCLFNISLKSINDNNYDIAIDNFEHINSKDKYINEFSELITNYCNNLLKNEEYNQVIDLLSKTDLDTKNINDVLDIAVKKLADFYIEKDMFGNAITTLKISKYFSEESDEYKKCLYLTAKNKLKNKLFDEAINIYEKLGNYEDSFDMINECKYQYIVNNKNNSDLKTLSYSEDLIKINYKNVNSIYDDVFGWKVSLRVFHGEDPYHNAIDREIDIEISAYGGKPNEKIKLTYSRTLLECFNENRYEYIFSDYGEEKFSSNPIYLSDGETYKCGFGADEERDLFKVYDEDGNLLCEQEFTIMD